MLLEFTIGNYKSFKDIKTFSMVASSIKEYQENNTFIVDKYRLLKSSIFYGANASGKSNLFHAMNFMQSFIFSSVKDTQITDTINVDNFKLSTETENKPSIFEIIILINNVRYRYGFQLNETQIVNEWLFFTPTSKEAKLFIREKNDISLGQKFKEGKGLKTKTRVNALFLSVCAQFNGEFSSNILKWFSNLNVISGLDDEGYMGFTLDKLKDPKFKIWALNYLNKADIDILDLKVDYKELKLDEVPKNLKSRLLSKKNVESVHEYSLSTFHQKYDKKGRKLTSHPFNIEENESEGTKKILALAGPIWDSLENGKVLFIDEFEARLHQILTTVLTRVFNSSKTNKKNAQFILASHDVSLLNKNILRRDQMWFVRKDKYGVSDIYSLSDFKESNKIVRKDALYGKQYLQGKFDAIPEIYELEELFEVING